MTLNAPIRPALRLAALCLLGILVPTRQAIAATAPGNIAVSATVQATCLNTTTPIAFGTYTGVQVNSTATITVTCTNTTPYTVALDAGLGTGPAATVTTRHMNGASAAGLAYGLATDAAQGTNFTTTGSLTATGAAQPITVYGRVAAGLFVTPGAYTDTVTATVNY